MEPRIIELESRLCLADDAIDALNATVYRQQQQIDELRRSLQYLVDHVRKFEPLLEQRTLRDDIPPHY